MEEFLIGSDPEAVLFVDGGRVTAVDYFNGISVGSDNAQVPVEFRPDPSPTVEEHINNIRSCIGELLKEIYDKPEFMAGAIRLRGGGAPTGHPIGGHIHISADSDIEEKAECIGSVLFSYNWLTGGEEFMNRLKLSQYGGPFDYRVKHHGFETRTPYSWLVSPMVTGAYLSIAWILMANWPVAKKNKDIGELISLYHKKASRLFVSERNDRSARQYSGNDKELYKRVYTLIQRIFDWMPSLEGYNDVKKYIHYAKNMAKRLTAVDCNRNIFTVWGVNSEANIDVVIGKEKGLSIKDRIHKRPGSGLIYIYGSGKKRGNNFWVWSNDVSAPMCKDVVKYLQSLGYSVKHGRWGKYEHLSPSVGITIGIPLDVRGSKDRTVQIVNGIVDIVSSHRNDYSPILWW